MRTMNYKLLCLIMTASLLGASCSDDDVLTSPNAGGITSNSGTTSLKNLSVLFNPVDPTIIDATVVDGTGLFTKTDVTVTVFIGDRNNQQITDPRTIFFKSEYGLIQPSCDTDETGSCSVTWSAIDRPVIGGPGSDGFTTIVAYTTGEEAFSDNNGNGIFDDLDSGAFIDQEEPYIDFELRSGLAGEGIFDGNDVVIDTRNGIDTAGNNGFHDIADGVFNGRGCTHSTLCSTTITSPVIWTAGANGILAPAVAPPPATSYNVGGTLLGLVGASVTLQNNLTDNLIVSANGGFTFATQIADTLTYNVTVSASPLGETCLVTNGMGTIAGGNVTNVIVSCAQSTYAISGTLGGTGVIPAATSLVIRNTRNGGATEDITYTNADTLPTAINFTTPHVDGDTYAVTIFFNDTGLDCTTVPIAGGSNADGTGTIADASGDVTDIAVTCN